MFTHKGNCDGTLQQCSRRKGKRDSCGTKRLEGGLSEAISAILCFDLLPLWRSNHLTVKVYQAATVLFRPAILVHIFLNHILRGEILTCLDQGTVYRLVHLPGRFVRNHRQCSEMDVACVDLGRLLKFISLVSCSQCL